MTPREQAMQMVDQARALEAQALGKRMEAATLLGLHDEARRYMAEQRGLAAARRSALLAQAEARGECFFDAAGRIDTEALR